MAVLCYLNLLPPREIQMPAASSFSSCLGTLIKNNFYLGGAFLDEKVAVIFEDVFGHLSKNGFFSLDGRGKMHEAGFFIICVIKRKVLNGN